MVVSSPSLVDPWKNSTLVILPSVSAALAVILMLAGAVYTKPVTGEVMATVGGTATTTGALIKIFTAAEVVVAPVLSMARAVKE